MMMRKLEFVVIIMLITTTTAATTTTVYGQAMTPITPDISEDGTFQNEYDGIALQVPEGWVVQDVDNNSTIARSSANNLGFTVLAVLCPENEAIPAIGRGAYNCEEAPTSVIVFKDFALNEKPEFSALEDNVSAITVYDYLAYRLNKVTESGVRDIVEIADRSPRVVNVTFIDTGQVIPNPARMLEFEYEAASPLLQGVTGPMTTFNLLTIINEAGTVHGYYLGYDAEPLEDTLPAPAQQIFDTFEILALSPSSSPQQEERQQPLLEQPQQQQPQTQLQRQLQQLQQNQGTSVSIVPGSSSLTTDAYTPNPVQAGVGDTVTWTNDDTQPHTATSGEAISPDGRFDSGILAPAAIFEYTFTEPGEYPYFCLLHPNMVGTVTVTAAGGGSESTSIGSNPNTASSMGDDAAGGPLSELTEPFQDLFGSGDQTAGSSSNSGGTSPGSSTSSSSSSPSSSGGSRCPDGFHRSPSGDCERVTDTRGMPRCPDGYHRSPSGNCEYVG
jgi:plastocyanin